MRRILPLNIETKETRQKSTSIFGSFQIDFSSIPFHLLLSAIALKLGTFVAAAASVPPKRVDTITELCLHIFCTSSTSDRKICQKNIYETNANALEKPSKNHFLGQFCGSVCVTSCDVKLLLC